MQVAVEGRNIHYQCYGSGAIPMLLVHNWLLDGRVWENVVLGLDSRWKVYVIDLPGSGLSRVSVSDPVIVEMARTIAGFVSGLDLSQPVLVGSSTGATYVLEAAMRFPKMTRRVVSVGSAAHMFVRDPISSSQRLEDLLRMLGESRSQAIENIVDGWLQVNNESALDGIRERLRRIAEEQPSQIDHQLACHFEYDPRSRLPMCSVPVTFLHGEHDSLPFDIVRECASLVKDSQIEVLPKLGHLPHVEDPECFASVLNRVGGES